MDKKLITEDWKWQYTKSILENKFSEATNLIGYCVANPIPENIRMLLGKIMDAISYIPISIDDKESVEYRDFLIEKLNEIFIVLNGSPGDNYVKSLREKYGIQIIRDREGNRIVYKKANLPVLVPYLVQILKSALDFATAKGLRVQLPLEKKLGLERILEEEGFEDLELEEDNGKKV